MAYIIHTLPNMIQTVLGSSPSR